MIGSARCIQDDRIHVMIRVVALERGIGHKWTVSIEKKAGYRDNRVGKELVS